MDVGGGLSRLVSPKKTMVKGGCAEVRMWQRVKGGFRCGFYPHFTRCTQPRLATNKRRIKLTLLDLYASIDL